MVVSWEHSSCQILFLASLMWTSADRHWMQSLLHWGFSRQHSPSQESSLKNWHLQDLHVKKNKRVSSILLESVTAKLHKLGEKRYLFVAVWAFKIPCFICSLLITWSSIGFIVSRRRKKWCLTLQKLFIMEWIYF